MLFQLQESTISKEKAAVQSELGQSKTRMQELEKKGWLCCTGLTFCNNIWLCCLRSVQNNQLIQTTWWYFIDERTFPCLKTLNYPCFWCFLDSAQFEYGNRGVSNWNTNFEKEADFISQGKYTYTIHEKLFRMDGMDSVTLIKDLLIIMPNWIVLNFGASTKRHSYKLLFS